VAKNKNNQKQKSKTKIIENKNRKKITKRFMQGSQEGEQAGS